MSAKPEVLQQGVEAFLLAMKDCGYTVSDLREAFALYADSFPVAPAGAPTEALANLLTYLEAGRYPPQDVILSARALLSAQGCELATDATKQQMFNGLTQEETDATASVMGLVHPAATPIDQDFRRRPASSEAAPSAEGSE